MIVLSTVSPDKSRRIPRVDQGLLKPMGELAVSFSMLEEGLTSHIKLLMYPFDQLEDTVADVVSSELSFRRRVELIQCLFDLRSENESQKEQLKDLCRKAFQLEEQRNVVTTRIGGWILMSTSACA
jgi:hypothetical protein